MLYFNHGKHGKNQTPMASGLLCRHAFSPALTVKDHHPFPIQIIATGELEEKEFMWLNALTRKIKRTTAFQLLQSFGDLQNSDEKAFGESVVDFSVNINSKVFNTFSGEEISMLEALQPIFEPVIRQKLEPALIEKGRAEGISVGRAEGITVGRAEGEAKKEAEILQQLIALGVSESVINQIFTKQK